MEEAARGGISPMESDAIQAVLDEVRALTLGRRPQRRLPPNTTQEDDVLERCATRSG
jgi:hypothetical protein